MKPNQIPQQNEQKIFFFKSKKSFSFFYSQTFLFGGFKKKVFLDEILVEIFVLWRREEFAW